MAIWSGLVAGYGLSAALKLVRTRRGEFGASVALAGVLDAAVCWVAVYIECVLFPNFFPYPLNRKTNYCPVSR